MLYPSLMASTILFTTATGGGDEGAFDPRIHRSDLTDQPTSLGFEGPICDLHVCIVLIHYGHVKTKNRTPLEVLSSNLLKPYKPISTHHRYPLTLPHVTERLLWVVDFP